jgi:hypothetical protein
MLPIVKEGLVETSKMRANVKMINGEATIKALGVKKGTATLQDLKDLVTQIEQETLTTKQ